MKRRVGFTDSLRYTCLEDLQQVNNFASISGLNLDYCGKEQCEPNWKFGPYVREKFVLHFILEGRGSYRVRGKEFALAQGQAFLIYPKEETVYWADSEEPWYYTWVGFSGYRAEEFVKNMGFSMERPVITLKNSDHIQGCMKRMLDARKLTVTNELLRMSQLLEIFSVLMEDNKNDNEGEEKQHDYPRIVYVQCAMDYMDRHFRENIKIDDIAENVGISRSYLSGTFKKEFKMSPQEYLVSLRLGHAARMLENTSEPINVVAYESGYENPLSFSKAFKRKYNMSPKEFRDSKLELSNNKNRDEYTGSYPM